jgi:hypothetical protein
MPNLLLYAPCEKAIIDANGALSIISILGKLTIAIPPNAPPPPAKALLPMPWAIVTIWQLISDWEFERTFEQRGYLISEAGTVLMDSVGQFQFKRDADSNLATVVVYLPGFPFSAGSLKVKIAIREKSDAQKEWRESGSFPLDLILKPVELPPTLQ